MRASPHYRTPYDGAPLRSELLARRSQGWWPLGDVLKSLGQSGPRRVVVLWLAAIALCIATGVAVVYFDLSGIPVSLGLATVDVTVYPPVLIGMLLLLWLGPSWAIVATYLATFAVGAYAGLSPGANLVFSLADPILLLVIWSGLVVMDVPYEIRTGVNWTFFLLLALTGSIASSLGALVWNHSQVLDVHQGLRIWEGWVVGAFLQAGLVVPIHHLAGGGVRAWLEKELRLPRRQNPGPRGGGLLLAAALLFTAVLAAIVARGLIRMLADENLSQAAFAERLPELGLFAALVMATFVGTTVLLTVALTRRSEREQALARVDGLTGCLNRIAFAEAYSREAGRCARLGSPLSIAFLDLDHFKRINDQYGYRVGDHVLCEVANRVSAMLRGSDYLFRWGGEEFIALLPHTSEHDAANLAERIRQAVRDVPVTHAAVQVAVTASLGVAGVDEPSDSPADLVNRAAEACKAAKSSGRDAVQTRTLPVQQLS